jgi:methionine-rich copper-binding protein CopC
MTTGRQRFAAALAVVAFAVLGPAAPASAGGALAGSDPVDGAVLSTPPAAIELRLTAEPDPVLSHVSVRDAAGTELNTGDLTAGPGGTLRQDVTAGGAGDYSVAFHIEFTDGSELTGAQFFSAGTGVPPRAGAAERAAATAALPTHQHSVDALSAVLLVLDFAVVLAVVLLLMRTPRGAPKRAWRL